VVWIRSLIQYNAKTSGRDKFFRLLQNIINFYLWRANLKTTGRPSKEDESLRGLQHLADSLSSCRQLLRLGNFLSAFDAALKSLHLDDGVLRFLLTTSKLQSALDVFLDNLLFVHKLGFYSLTPGGLSSVKGNKDKFSFLSVFLSLLRDFYEIMSIVEHEVRREKETKRRFKARRPGSQSNLNSLVDDKSKPQSHLNDPVSERIAPKTVDFCPGDDATSKLIDTTTTTTTTNANVNINAKAPTSNGLFYPSSSPTSIRDIDLPKFLQFLWTHHFPLCLDTIKNGADLVLPMKNVGLITDVEQGFVYICGMTSSLCGIFTIWNPVHRLVPA